jgi:hypothetical protein
MAPPCRLFLNDCAGGDGVLGAASKQANELGAALAASSKPFVCAHAGCGRFFSTVATLHEHLSATGHHSAPTGSNGTFTQLPVDNKVLVLASVKDLSPDQKTVVAAALATGRSVVLGGAGGTGKTVITRALVEIYNTLWPDCVLWLCPTGIARLVAGSLACTVNSAMGIGRPADDVTWGELVEKGQTPKVQALLRGKRLLVVDESHRAGEREMTALDALLRWANDSDLPFAGIQTCNTGDSCQTLNFTDKKLAAHVKAQLPGVTSGARSWLMSPLVSYSVPHRCVTVLKTSHHAIKLKLSVCIQCTHGMVPAKNLMVKVRGCVNTGCAFVAREVDEVAVASPATQALCRSKSTVRRAFRASEKTQMFKWGTSGRPGGVARLLVACLRPLLVGKGCGVAICATRPPCRPSC